MAAEKKPVLLSGIQPTGRLMIGNYIGAIRNWVKLQNQYDCLFVLVDLHAITVKQNPAELLDRCYEFLSLYLACGIDPGKSTIFVQSHVPGHCQLAWILNCYTNFGELSRMTQFKAKSGRHRTNVNVGLFNYPVLMAADILLYRANLVPVGDDQKQHLELTRDLARRFNRRFGEIFTIPNPFISAVGSRIMSLQDPNNKMSKSDANPDSTITLLDSAETVVEKIKKAVTDSGKEVRFAETKPGISNLLTIFSTFSGESIRGLEGRYEGKGYGVFKADLAETIIEFLKPIQQNYYEIAKDRAVLHQILKKGAAEAIKRSQVILKHVQEAVGFILT